MKRIALAIALGFLAPACATSNLTRSESRLAYGCSDAVIMGFLSNTAYGPTQEIEGDLLGHGWFSADLSERRHLAGSVLSKPLRVRYFGHAQMREDIEFTFVITPAEDRGGYIVIRAQLSSARPRLDNQCQ